MSDITYIIPEILKNGIKLNDEITMSFKDAVNYFFRNTNKFIAETYTSPLTLKFDDRLNIFFLYNEYLPKFGFYEENNTLYLIKFNNGQINQCVAYIATFANWYSNKTTKQKEKE
jgi:hypothetical protein